MARLSVSERRDQIVELLTNNGTLKITDLAKHFQVSRETIRQDLIALNEAGVAKKWFGGAVPMVDFKIQPVDGRLLSHQEERLKICEKALEYIPEQAIIFLDTGSTALCMAKLLKSRSGCTIITNSIPAINELIGSGNKTIATGGNINSQTMSMTGMQTIELLERLKTNVAILGSSGFERHQGPTTNDFDDGQIKRVVIKNAQTNIVVAGSEKAAYSSLIQYTSWENIDYLITDAEFPKEIAAEIMKRTEVVVA